MFHPLLCSVQMYPSSHQLSDHSLIQWHYTVTNQGTRSLTKKYHCEINVLHPLVYSVMMHPPSHHQSLYFDLGLTPCHQIE